MFYYWVIYCCSCFIYYWVVYHPLYDTMNVNIKRRPSIPTYQETTRTNRLNYSVLSGLSVHSDVFQAREQAVQLCLRLIVIKQTLPSTAHDADVNVRLQCSNTYFVVCKSDLYRWQLLIMHSSSWASHDVFYVIQSNSYI